MFLYLFGNHMLDWDFTDLTCGFIKFTLISIWVLPELNENVILILKININPRTLQHYIAGNWHFLSSSFITARLVKILSGGNPMSLLVLYLRCILMVDMSYSFDILPHLWYCMCKKNIIIVSVWMSGSRNNVASGEAYIWNP